MPDLNLSKPEVEAVMDYIWQHVRASPKGKGYKVWQKMFDFVEGEAEGEGENEIFGNVHRNCGI